MYVKGSSAKKPTISKMFKAFWITLVNPGAADEMTGRGRKLDEETTVKGKGSTKKGRGKKLGS
jgi:hypothetical protein